jgi:DNA transformation protein and related proteins
MPVTPSYRDYVADQLAALRGLVVKRMFGGVGLYCEQLMFGVTDDDVVYLRVDDETRPVFVKRGMPALRPVRNKVSENYFALPEDVLVDSEELMRWAKRAIRAAGSPTAAAARKQAARKPARPAAAKKSARKAAKRGSTKGR